MSDYLLVVDCFFDILTMIFNTMISHWFLGIVFLTSVFALIINLFLMIKGTR